MLGSAVLNAAALFGEKALLNSGIRKVIDRGVTKKSRAEGALETAIGESAQEYFDQVQQTYMTQKEGEKTLAEIAVSPEAQLAAMSGGIMGSA